MYSFKRPWIPSFSDCVSVWTAIGGHCWTGNKSPWRYPTYVGTCWYICAQPKFTLHLVVGSVFSGFNWVFQSMKSTERPHNDLEYHSRVKCKLNTMAHLRYLMRFLYNRFKDTTLVKIRNALKNLVIIMACLKYLEDTKETKYNSTFSIYSSFSDSQLHLSFCKLKQPTWQDVTSNTVISQFFWWSL